MAHVCDIPTHPSCKIISNGWEDDGKSGRSGASEQEPNMGEDELTLIKLDEFQGILHVLIFSKDSGGCMWAGEGVGGGRS